MVEEVAVAASGSCCPSYFLPLLDRNPPFVSYILSTSPEPGMALGAGEIRDPQDSPAHHVDGEWARGSSRHENQKLFAGQGGCMLGKPSTMVDSLQMGVLEASPKIFKFSDV